MNKVILMGNPTRDPEIRYSGNNDTQLAVARFTLAVQRRRTSGESKSDFIGCVAFDRAAEFAERFVKKGVKIGIIGRIQTNSYTNKDGKKVYTTDVVVEEFEFCQSKKSEDSANRPGPSENEEFMQIPDGVDDEGLPFN